MPHPFAANSAAFWRRAGFAFAALVFAAAAPAATAPPNGAAPPTAMPEPSATTAPKLLPITEFTLDNGLRVVLLPDTSDPMVAVALGVHVGSARELPGRTGFAHLFEHLLFLDSENLGPGGADKLATRIGSSGENGSTGTDATVYQNSAPRDALEKMLWSQSEKLGYFINTVSAPVLAKEKQIVKNEKRQRVDNQPYGHVDEVLLSALYPVGHPYRTPVIGALADLDAATLDDVRGFYRRWYVPNNAAVVIAGDFDPAQAREWVQKYFGEIPRGDATPRAPAQLAKLAATKRLLLPDDYAKLPELTLAWPGVPVTDADVAPLTALLALLTDGRDAPLTKVIVEERKLADEVQGVHYEDELAGSATLTVRAFAGVDLDRVQAALDEGFRRFERKGIDAAALARVKTQQEARFYAQLEGIEGKAVQLARSWAEAGRPDFAEIELARLRAVTPADVQRVYRQYLKGRPHVALSTVPKVQRGLALARSTPAKVVKEAIVQGAESELPTIAAEAAPVARTPSSFDRSVEPPYGAKPVLTPVPVWKATLANGLAVSGIDDRELPVVRFQLAVDGGQRLEAADAQAGLVALYARMATRGTARRTAAELENALKTLGAEIEVRATPERLVFEGSTLARNLAPTLALLREVVLEPRWDAAELALAKASQAAELDEARSNPYPLAVAVMKAATYPKGHPFARELLGSRASVAAFTMADLKRLHARALAPNVARFRLVGAASSAEVQAALAPLADGWPAASLALPALPPVAPPAARELWFYDVPSAKQSMLLLATPSLRRADPDYAAASAANYLLGGGGFASRFTQELREKLGYTYGIASGFESRATDGAFVIQSPVRANVTLEALQRVLGITGEYGATFTDADLATTQGSLLKSRAIEFESLAAKLDRLAAIGDFGLPEDYVARDDAVVGALTTARVQELAGQYLRPEALRVVVVGDAATQKARLAELGLGAPRDANALLGP